MLKSKEIIHRDIIAISNGEKIKRVRDIVFDHGSNQVLAFLVDEGGWFSGAKVVPFENIESIGKNAVMVPAPESITTRKSKELRLALSSKVTLIGTRVLTTAGQDLGRISDVFFEEKTGRVVGYEATGGMFADLSNGRAFIPEPDRIQVGRDSAIVPVEVAKAMEEQTFGGVKGVWQSTTGAVKQTYGSIAGAGIERQKTFVLGKSASNDITMEDGSVLIKKGETITEHHIEMAEWHGKLRALELAAWGGVFTGTYQLANEKMQGSFESVRDASVERQKAWVVGKTAGNDIELEDGHILIKQGETITTEHADKAAEHGKLIALGNTATSGVLSQTYQTASSKAQESFAQMRGASIERQKAWVVGKTAGNDIELDDEENTLLIKQGETITAEHADKAAEHGKLIMLGTAATGGILSQTYQTASSKAQESFAQVRDASIERQKAWVLGKPAGSDLVLEDGQTLIKQGETITAEHAEKAAEHGKLLTLGTAITSNTLNQTYQSASTKVQEGVSKSVSRMQEGMGQLREAGAGRQKEYVIGKVAGREVRSEAGELIVMKDATITKYQAEHAERVGALMTLAAAAVAGRVSSGVHELQERRTIDPNSLEAAIGRRARQEVRTESGSLVVAQGQIVSQIVANRAEHLGVSDALISATRTESLVKTDSITPLAEQATKQATTAQTALAQNVSEFNKNVSEFNKNVASNTSSFLDKAKHWLAEQNKDAEASFHKREEEQQHKRIRSALGRPVTRVILAPDDSVILNVGEVVTNSAIQAAQAGEVLDILLESVSYEKVNINNLESRPALSGESALKVK